MVPTLNLERCTLNVEPRTLNPERRPEGGVTNRSVVIGLCRGTVLAAGCGYQGQVSLPQDLRRIHVTVTNAGTFRPGLDSTLAQVLTQRILSAGGRVVAEETP